MYIGKILMYLTWPILIVLSYLLVRIALKKFDKNRKSEEVETQG